MQLVNLRHQLLPGIRRNGPVPPPPKRDQCGAAREVKSLRRATPAFPLDVAEEEV
jgi:hypothetical protein